MSGVQSMSDDELLAIANGGAAPSGGMRVLTGPKVKDAYRTLSQEEVSADPRLNPKLAYQVSPDGRVSPIEGQKEIVSKQIPQSAVTRLQPMIDVRDSLNRQFGSFNKDFGGNIAGTLENKAQALFDVGTPGQRDWWADFYATDNAVRNDLFGATLTASEQAAYEATTIYPSMSAKEIQANLERRVGIINGATKRQQKFMKANNFDADAVDALFEPLTPSGQLADADATETLGELPPEANARLKGWIEGHRGQPIDKAEFVAFANGVLTDTGAGVQVNEADQEGLDKFITALSEGKPVGGFQQPKREMTEYEQWMNPLAQSDIGAFLIGGGQTVTGNFLDELSGNPNANAAIDQIQEENPITSALGQFSGGAAGAFIPGGAVATAGRAAATGAGFGAFSGLGAGEGGFTDRLDDAAIGALIGAGGGYAGQKLFDRFSGGIKPPSESAVRYKNAVDAGISEPTLGQTRGGIFSTIEKGLEVAPGGSGIVSRAANKSRDEAAAAADNVAAQFGEGGDFVSRGQALQRGGDKWIDKFYKTAKSAYDNVPISKDAEGSLSNVQGVLDGLQSKFESNPRLNDAFKSSKVGIFIDALGKKGSKISFGDLKELRTRLSQDINFQRFGDDATSAELKAIRKGLTDDMKATAMVQGPDALRKFNRANDMFAAGEKRIEDALTAIVGDRKMPAAEAASALIDRISKSNKGTSNIKMLADIRKSMPKEEWGEVSSSIIRLAGQPLNSEGRDFSAKTFTDTFRDMAPEAKNLIFGTGEHRKALDEFADVAKGMAQTEVSGNPSGSAKIMNVLMGVASPALAAGQFASGNAIARAWTNPAFVRWATGYTKMMKGAAKAGGQPNNAKQMELLKKLATTEPSIAAEVMGLHNMFNEEE